MQDLFYDIPENPRADLATTRESLSIESFAPQSQGDWAELIDPPTVMNSYPIGEVVVVGPGGGGSSAGGWYWDEGDWGDTSTYTDTASEPRLCEVTDDIGIITAPDGATYKVPQGITAAYLLDAIAYLQSISDPLAKLGAFKAMFEDPDHPHFIDFKDWGTDGGPTGSSSGGTITYWSAAAGEEVTSSVFEPFGNYFYGFCGVLGGIPAEALGWVAGAVQTGNEMWERAIGQDGPQDVPHVAKGINDALTVAAWQELGTSITVFDVRPTSCG